MAELPIGLMMSLAMHPEAMQRFSDLPEAKRQKVVARARIVRSKREMHELTERL